MLKAVREIFKTNLAFHLEIDDFVALNIVL